MEKPAAASGVMLKSENIQVATRPNMAKNFTLGSVLVSQIYTILNVADVIQVMVIRSYESCNAFGDGS